jgi:hypothetical protein
MENDDTLSEFLRILGRIKELVGEAPMLCDNGIDLDESMQRLRQSGNNDDADELADLIQRADEIKAQQLAKS